MIQTIVAFPKLEDGQKIRSLLLRCGFAVAAVCTTGAQAVSCMDGLDGGIVVCGYRLTDMLYSELYSYLPAHFSMLLIASAKYESECELPEGAFLPLPLKVQALAEALEALCGRPGRGPCRRAGGPRERSSEEEARIRDAKRLLMERNGMREAQAHRYLQKYSMDTGRTLADTAGWVLRMWEKRTEERIR